MKKFASWARERAEKTLQPVGMKIDSIFAVSPVAFPAIQRAILGSTVPTAETESALSAQGLKDSDNRLARITIGQSVHVIYLISPAKYFHRSTSGLPPLLNS